MRHDVDPRALAEQVTRDQKCRRGTQRRAGDDVNRPFDNAEDEAGAGCQQNSRQHADDDRGHDQHEQRRGPGALPVDPLEHRDELLVHAEVDQHADEHRDHGNARDERAERRFDRFWQEAGRHGRYRVFIPHPQSNPRPLVAD